MKRIFPLLLFLLFPVIAWFLVPSMIALQSSTLLNGASVEPVDCWFPVPAGKRIECGWVTTRAAEGQEQHQLPVVIVRHSRFSNDPSPVVFIQGGPGGAAGLDKETIPWWLQDIETYDWGRDFVLYDQRGSGLARPSLRCSEVLEGLRTDAQLALLPDEENRRYLEYLRTCHDRLVRDGHDLAQYNTASNSDDLADLVNLIEPGPWTLFGASYGTRIALETERRHPELVRDMVLDSVYPHDQDGFLTWPMILGRAVERVLDQHEQAGLKQELNTLVARFDKQPQRLPIMRYNGQSYAPVLTGSRFYMALFAATYSSDIVDLIPRAIDDLLERRNSSRALTDIVTNSVELMLDESFSEPVFQSVSCREDQVGREAEYRRVASAFIADYPFMQQLLIDNSPADICRFWKSGRVEPGFDRRVVTDKPVLILAGEFDAVTPLAWAREMHDYLPASRLVIVPRGGHGVTMSDLCTMGIARDFLEDPTSQLPQHCNGDN